MKRVIAALLLACAPVMASWDPDQVWSWDKVPNADGYRIYWSDSPSGPWSQCQSATVLEEHCPEGDRCEIDIPEPPGDKLFFVVTAYNQHGESITEHGPIEECGETTTFLLTIPAPAHTIRVQGGERPPN